MKSDAVLLAAVALAWLPLVSAVQAAPKPVAPAASAFKLGGDEVYALRDMLTSCTRTTASLAWPDTADRRESLACARCADR